MMSTAFAVAKMLRRAFITASHRCAIKMYLICMCWLCRAGTAKTGA